MKTILQIDASLFGTDGQSSQLSAQLVEGLKNIYSDADVVHRNVSDGSMPHFDAATIAAVSEGKAELADTLIKELQEADAVVISAPMYNFAIPTQLKSWFDHITRAGATFKYTEDGPVGLLGDKKVFVITTSGGQHGGSSRDGVLPWLKTMLWFIGLDKDLHVIRAEGLSQSALKDQSRAQAQQEVSNLLSAIAEESSYEQA